MPWSATILDRLRRKSKRRLDRAPGAEAAGPDSAPPSSLHTPEAAEARLTRLADWCLGGQAAAAELELHDWQRHEDCPAHARALLASLLARRGRIEQALAVIAPLARQDAEPDAERALLHVALLLAAELPDSARRAALKLYHQHGYQGFVRVWLEALQPPGLQDLPVVPEATIEHLAAELVGQRQVIPALVAAQQRAPDAGQIHLLRRAIDRAARDLSDNPPSALAACQAMAELALLAGDADDARRWAHRGLRLDPYAVRLALVLAEVSDDPAVGPPAQQVLGQAADAFPDYPDLQAAAIRRERADGADAAARMRLRRWLARRPDQPEARELAKEMAA
jgi:hypothetical protein